MSQNRHLGCTACGSSGQVHCVVCRGRGVVNDSPPWQDCSECGGTGRKACPASSASPPGTAAPAARRVVGRVCPVRCADTRLYIEIVATSTVHSFDDVFPSHRGLEARSYDAGGDTTVSLCIDGEDYAEPLELEELPRGTWHITWWFKSPQGWWDHIDVLANLVVADEHGALRIEAD